MLPRRARPLPDWRSFTGSPVALDHGVKIVERSFDEVAAHPTVVEAYLGRDPEALAEA